MPFLARVALLALLAPLAHAEPEVPDVADLVRAVEAARGLAFERPPRLVRIEAGPSFETALRGIPDRIAIECPAPGFTVRLVESAVADPATDRVLASSDASPDDVRVALAHLLDAQHHPALVKSAAHRTGDAGVALRGLLAASACATAQGGLGEPPPPGPSDEPLPPARLEVAANPDGVRLLRSATLVATTFLSKLPDREAAFRQPPLSTLELLVLGRWEPGAPLELTGAPPEEPGCRVERDESLGVLALLRELTRAGGDVPSGALAGWRGDRLITFSCEDERTPWLYVAQLERARDAEDLRAAADSLLPEELARPLAARASGQRVLAWHGVDEARAQAFAAGLETRPLR